MTKAKKKISLILIFLILIYYVLGVFINHKSYAALGVRERTSDLSTVTNEKYPGVAALINELQTAHPDWTFTILYTGLDWNEVLYNETTVDHGKSLTQKITREWLCTHCNPDINNLTAHEPGWYCASQEAVAYYLDIRNWLTEDYIFTFEGLTFDESIQNEEGVNKILKGTFMDVPTITYTDTAGNSQVINKSYVQIIMEAAREYNVSAYHLASRLRQEQGAGDSGLISGTFKYTDSNGNVEDYTGYYNYFNVNAYGSTNAEIIRRGLKYASSDSRSFKWTTPELAIKGGAEFLAKEYIGSYQDNLYLQKYSVDSYSNSLYTHQYMANISAPFTEGNSVRSAYEEIDAINNSFNFVIPVYENMPNDICRRPENNMTLVTNNVQTTASYLKIRTGASTNYSSITSVPRGTTLLRIEMANLPGVDGNYWDRVVYNTGETIIIGYATREYLIDIADVVTVNEQDVTKTSVNLRNGPGTSSTTIIKTLSENVNVTIMDKIPYTINGHIWYRVKLEDGTQGYLASTYLKSYAPPANYKIDGNYMVVAPTTTLSSISGLTSSNGAWGTGAIVNLNGVDYTLAMVGDANGDGVIDSADLLKIVKHLKELSKIDILSAGDANRDGIIDSADLLKIVKYLKGTTSITI